MIGLVNGISKKIGVYTFQIHLIYKIMTDEDLFYNDVSEWSCKKEVGRDKWVRAWCRLPAGR